MFVSRHSDGIFYEYSCFPVTSKKEARCYMGENHVFELLSLDVSAM